MEQSALANIRLMSRNELEEFTDRVVQLVMNLEEENKSLRYEASASKTIDIEVINGWRNWNETLDNERKKWSDMATQTSADNIELRRENDHIREVCSRILESLDGIHKLACDKADPKKKSIVLVRALEQIADAAYNDKEKIMGFMLEGATPDNLEEPLEDDEQ